MRMMPNTSATGQPAVKPRGATTGTMGGVASAAPVQNRPRDLGVGTMGGVKPKAGGLSPRGATTGTMGGVASAGGGRPGILAGQMGYRKVR